MPLSGFDVKVTVTTRKCFSFISYSEKDQRSLISPLNSGISQTTHLGCLFSVLQGCFLIQFLDSYMLIHVALIFVHEF